MGSLATGALVPWAGSAADPVLRGLATGAGPLLVSACSSAGFSVGLVSGAFVSGALVSGLVSGLASGLVSADACRGACWAWSDPVVPLGCPFDWK